MSPKYMHKKLIYNSGGTNRLPILSYGSLQKVKPAKDRAMESNKSDTKSGRDNGEVEGLGQHILPHPGTPAATPPTCSTQLWEEHHQTSHLQNKKKIRKSKQRNDRGEGYLLSCRFELNHEDFRHNVNHLEQLEQKLETKLFNQFFYKGCGC
ncbi:hypothetical protein HAX54_025613 [Datura stramonium]|uniref:Uncharacterized protein n=1 Tax=Datura stramonium TaxID=4076 RepID=A0ABS8V014_DATST|nr:hypothetical protein [Datura stramonium]